MTFFSQELLVHGNLFKKEFTLTGLGEIHKFWNTCLVTKIDFFKVKSVFHSFIRGEELQYFCLDVLLFQVSCSCDAMVSVNDVVSVFDRSLLP